jgi:hypothetical protein
MANGNLAPERYKPSSLLTLHEGPDLHPTRLEDRDFPSGASYINIREGYVRLQSLLFHSFTDHLLCSTAVQK